MLWASNGWLVGQTLKMRDKIDSDGISPVAGNMPKSLRGQVYPQRAQVGHGAHQSYPLGSRIKPVRGVYRRPVLTSGQ